VKRKRSKRLLIGLLSLLLLAAGLTGCSLRRPLLYGVEVTPNSISPNADGKDDVTHIFYGLSKSAYVSIFFEDHSNHRYYFRQHRRRAAGRYDVDWGGLISGHTTYQNKYTKEKVVSQVLSAGQYRWTILAVDDKGKQMQQQGTITIVDPDTTLPEFRNFSVSPRVFTPNQDGIDDRVAITYFLSKDVAQIFVGLYSMTNTKHVPYPLVELPRAIKPTQAGLHYIDYEGGVDEGAEPPPDGLYAVVGRAQDAAGNSVVVSSTLTIKEGGVPRADIVNGEVTMQDKADGDHFITIGSTIIFTATVENYGKVPIRTSGPWPGARYNSDENFNTLAKRYGQTSWYEQAGVWRFAIDYQTNGGQDYPFRYAVGRKQDLQMRIIDGREEWYLLPGHRGLITGTITLNHKPPRNQIYFWAGLIHEEVGIASQNNRVGPTLFHIDIP